MADITNPAFVGIDNLDRIDNATEIKHPILISKYAPVANLKALTKEDKTTFIAIDVETKNNELEILGFCDYNPITKKYGYDYFLKQRDGLKRIIEGLAQLIDFCSSANKAICYWGKFDATHICKMLLRFNGYDVEEVMNTAQKYSKNIAGVVKSGQFVVEPIISVKIDYKNAEFGVIRTANNCLQFFLHTDKLKQNGKQPITVWGYDASTFYQDGLEKASKKFIPHIKYEKGDKDLHVIDFDKFYSNEEYKKEVLKSNEMDCTATKALMEYAQDMFINSFGVNPRTTISAGSFTNVALASILTEEENQSINFYNQLVNWKENGADNNDLINLYNIAINGYSAGQIDIIRQGHADNVGFADITSSYPSILNSLLDLKDSTIKTGKNCYFKDVPKPNGTNYIFVTARVNVDKEDIHTLTVKTPALDNEDFFTDEELEQKAQKRRASENFRPYGNFVASGLYEEFILLEKQHKNKMPAVQDVLEWVEIQTTGKPSPMRKVVQYLWNLRKQFLKEGNPAEYIVKLIINSLYGKLFECLKQYEEFTQGNIVFSGYRAGSYFNPILAQICTAGARIRLAEMQYAVEKKGGKTFVLMTDSLYFAMEEGKKATDYIPERFISILSKWHGLKYNGYTNEKFLGMYSMPEDYTDGLFLKAGWYEFFNPNKKVTLSDGEELKGVYELKVMGFFVDRHTKEELTTPYLANKIYYAMQNNQKNEYAQEYITMPKRDVITFGEIAESENGANMIELLGAIDEGTMQATFETVAPKREYAEEGKYFASFDELLHEIIETHPTNFGGLFSLDSRLLQCMNLLKGNLVNEEKQKAMPYKEQVKILSKQLGIPQKKGSNKGINGRDLKPQKMRAMLLEKGIQPLA